MVALGLLSQKNAVAGVDPNDFADFLLNLPGGRDPRPNLYELIPESGTFEPGAFFFKNIELEDAVREVFRCSGYRCVGADGIYAKQVIDGLDVLLSHLLNLFNAIITTCLYPQL